MNYYSSTTENDIRSPKEYGGFIPYNSCGNLYDRYIY